MRYLEKFEGFLLTESVEEAKKKIEVELNSKLEDMTQDEKNKLYSDLNKVSQKLGLSMEEMKDAKLVAKKLQELELNSNNENIFTRGRDYLQDKFSKLLMKIGVGGYFTNLLLLIHNESLPSVMQNIMPIAALALIISILAMASGMLLFLGGEARKDKIWFEGNKWNESRKNGRP